ncbi:MAG: potassium channel protein [Planctomycetes bacterium]|nr:potassium channel protein [Planctomycetota bacterium]
MNIKRRIVIGLVLLFLVLAIGTTGYWIIGGDLLNAVYMTVITAATVGYGEVVDISNPTAKVFTIVFIIISLMAIAVVTSLIAASILEIELSGYFRRRKMINQISKLSNHYIVCGAGETGVHIIQELSKTLHPFVVIDQNQERLDKLIAHIPDLVYIKGDATDDDVLLAGGIERASGVVAALPSDKDNLYITVMTKQYNSKARIVSLAVEDKAINKLKNAGADAVVSSAIIGGLRIVSEMTRPSAVKFLDTMIKQTTSTVRIEELTIGTGSAAAGKPLSGVPFKDRFNLLVLALMSQDGEKITYNPLANTALTAGLVVIVMGEVENIKKAKEFIG